MDSFEFELGTTFNKVLGSYDALLEVSVQAVNVSVDRLVADGNSLVSETHELCYHDDGTYYGGELVAGRLSEEQLDVMEAFASAKERLSKAYKKLKRSWERSVSNKEVALKQRGDAGSLPSDLSEAFEKNHSKHDAVKELYKERLRSLHNCQWDFIESWCPAVDRTTFLYRIDYSAGVVTQGPALFKVDNEEDAERTAPHVDSLVDGLETLGFGDAIEGFWTLIDSISVESYDLATTMADAGLDELRSAFRVESEKDPLKVAEAFMGKLEDKYGPAPERLSLLVRRVAAIVNKRKSV